MRDVFGVVEFTERPKDRTKPDGDKYRNIGLAQLDGSGVVRASVVEGVQPPLIFRTYLVTFNLREFQNAQDTGDSTPTGRPRLTVRPNLVMQVTGLELVSDEPAPPAGTKQPDGKAAA